MARSTSFSSCKNFRIGNVTNNSFRTIKKSKQNIHRHALTVTILCLLPSRDPDRCEFIQFCRSNCSEHDSLQQITEFELKYRPDESILWYTRPSGFPSKLVNTICRTKNLFLISKIRYYLKHLHEQLTRLYLNSLVWIPNSVVLYRGQKFTTKEFNKLIRNKGQIIFTTAFLSATSADDVAVAYAGHDAYSNVSLQDEISVIFKIVIRTKTTRSKPFAFIQEYSHIKDEKEILIYIGMAFYFAGIHKKLGFYEILLIHGEDEEEIEKDVLHKAIQSCSNGSIMTMDDFLISVGIGITPWDDFHRRPLSSFFEEVSRFRSDNVFNFNSNSEPLDLPIVAMPNSPTCVTHDHLIIWLDQHIGQDNVCNDLKEKLINAINITIDEPSERHEIDRLILNTDVYPRTRDQLITVTTIEECLALIATHYHKKIFLITSGALGQQLVPRVLRDYSYVDKIYIFCARITLHMHWAMDYADHILMFDFHHDLFSRVVYNIGIYYLEQGVIFSDLDDPRSALHCLYIAKKLIMRANHIFHPYFRFSLRTVEELITTRERQLPEDLVQNILNNLHYR